MDMERQHGVFRRGYRETGQWGRGERFSLYICYGSAIGLLKVRKGCSRALIAAGELENRYKKVICLST